MQSLCRAPVPYAAVFRFWPNPFAEGFKEYQFITASTLTSLTSLDGFQIDSDLRYKGGPGPR